MLSALRDEFPDMPLLPSIPLSVKSAESTAERTSVLQYMPRSTVAAAYREVGAWLEEHDPDAPHHSSRLSAATLTTTEAAVHV
jgi:chromosome partitioning protein